MKDWMTVAGYLGPILVFGPIVLIALFFVVRELVRWVPELIKRSEEKQSGPKVSKHVQKIRGRKDRRRRLRA
jgi:hypothetical protein